ncbi:MAG: OB-fold nucleic acid binding domain-containing protein, partial [Bacilli bacterium]
GMRSFLRDLKPENLEDLIAAIALFRPGPAINIPLYIKRRHHLEEPTYPDPILKTVLESTYGIMIYQEQIMQTANLYAGYTLGESDLLRRAMSKKKVEILQKEEAKFLEKSALMGHDEEKSKELFSFILKFAGYGFNRSHSVCYSLIAYKMAYLKVTYPKAFYTSLLTSVVSSISKTYEYFIEAKGSGIKILLPTINESMDFYQMTKEGILFPLTNIKGVGEITSRDIIAARGNEKFSSLYSAISRLLKAKISRKTIENLIYAGCFEEFSYNKKTLINNLDNLWSYATLVQEIDETLIMKPELTIEEEYSKKELLEQELDIFGFYFNEHPASSYRDLYKDTKYINNLANYFNKNITIIGLISKIKEVKTKKGDMMAFIDISDESGNISITLFPKIYLCYHDILKGDVIKVEGVVERRNDRLQVIVSNIVILE